MANIVYNRGKKHVITDSTSLESQGLYVMLVAASYGAAANATHNVVSDVVAYELTGYSRVALANATCIEDDSYGFAYLDADDVTFTAVASTQTVGGAVLYAGVTTTSTGDATANVIAFYDLVDTSTNDGDIVVSWATPANGGLLKLS